MKQQRTLTLIVFLLLNLNAFSQFSFFKDINTTEAGSNPTGFFSINSIKIFVAEEDGKFQLWRTDGTELGTEKISQLIVYSPNNKTVIGKIYYQILNNELYFLEVNEKMENENLWKTDGFSVTKVLNYDVQKLFWLNGSLII